MDHHPAATAVAARRAAVSDAVAVGQGGARGLVGDPGGGDLWNKMGLIWV